MTAVRSNAGRGLSVLFVLLGGVACAAAGAALGYGRDAVDCVLIDAPAAIRAGNPAAVRFSLTNNTNRTVQLRPRSCRQCGARLEGVPRELPPHDSREVRLVLNTSAFNGPQRFTAAISTDATPRVIVLTANVEIQADWVVRRLGLGSLPAGTPIAKRILIDNVPAENLVRVGSPTPPYWSARVISARDRSVEIELAATLPTWERSVVEPPCACDFSLFFSDGDVRRVQVIATAQVSPASNSAGLPLKANALTVLEHRPWPITLFWME